MQLTDLLAQSGALQSIARELGIDENKARQGAEALLPAIAGGFQKRAQPEQQGGGGGLGGLLGQLGGGSLLDQVAGPQPTDTSKGDSVLGHIFGSKDVSRTVAQHGAVQTGLDAGLLKRMLPMLAMAVAGYLAKHGTGDGNAAQGQQGGGLGGMLGGMLGGSGVGGMLGGLLGSGGGGNPLDKILAQSGQSGAANQRTP